MGSDGLQDGVCFTRSLVDRSCAVFLVHDDSGEPLDILGDWHSKVFHAYTLFLHLFPVLVHVEPDDVHMGGRPVAHLFVDWGQLFAEPAPRSIVLDHTICSQGFLQAGHVEFPGHDPLIYEIIFVSRVELGCGVRKMSPSKTFLEMRAIFELQKSVRRENNFTQSPPRLCRGISPPRLRTARASRGSPPLRPPTHLRRPPHNASPSVSDHGLD